MVAVLAETAPQHVVSFALWQSVLVIVLCAIGALLAQQALAVFNDGVRPFLLDFIQGRTTRPAMATIAFGLSAGFIFGLGAPMALSTGVLNPWLIFLPVEILGLLAPQKWIAGVAGAAWGAVCAFGLSGANALASDLPVDFLGALQQMSTPILWLFALFPVIAITNQFGRLRGALTFLAEFVVVVFFTMAGQWWNWSITPPSVAMAVGVTVLIVFAIRRDVVARQATRMALAGDATGGDVELQESQRQASAAMDELFGPNAARLRRNIGWFMLMGAGVCAIAASGIFGGGEATSFLIAKGDFLSAASVDAVRVLGFIPLIATTALASGAYALAGFTIVYPVGYLIASLGLPVPVAMAIALVVGAGIFALEVLGLSSLGKWLGRWPSVRDASDHIRNGITESLSLAILIGSLMAGYAMAGGMGLLIVGGLYLLNEAMGRPVVRMAAAPTAVIVGGVLLNILYWLHLFTPIAGS